MDNQDKIAKAGGRSYIPTQIVRDHLWLHENQIVTLKFIKRTNGEERVLTGRLGVRRYVKGVGMAYEPSDKDLFVIYDMAIARTLPEADRAKAYRCVPLDSVLEIHAGGRVVTP